MHNAMPRMESVLISIDEALRVRDSESQFACPECKQPVHVNAAGPGVPAHGQHVKGNKDCSLSDYSDAAAAPQEP